MTYDDLGPEDVLPDPEQDAHDDQAARAERGEYDPNGYAWAADAIDALVDAHPLILGPHRFSLLRTWSEGGWRAVQIRANDMAEAALRSIPEYAPAWLGVAVYALEQQHGYLAADAPYFTRETDK